MARAPNPHLRDALVLAATSVFAERGLAQARVSDITARAGTSKGAFYLFFESKEAAYVAIARGFLDEVLGHLRCYDDAACAELTPEGLALIDARDSALCDFLWHNRQRLAMVLEGGAGTQCAFMVEEFLDSILHTMRDSMTRHHALHPQLPMDPDFGAMLSAGLIFMYARRMIRATTQPDLASQIHQFREITAHGLMHVARSPRPTLLELPEVLP